MDPLSVAASVIALCQATAAVGRGVSILRSLNKAREEFWDLCNELERLKAILQQVQTSLEELEQCSKVPAKPDLLRQTGDEIADVTAELEGLTSRLLATARKQPDNEPPKVSRRKWTKEKEVANKLRNKARQARDDLGVCFSALLMSHGMNQLAVVLEVRDLVQTSLAKLDVVQSDVTQINQYSQGMQGQMLALTQQASGVATQLTQSQRQMASRMCSQMDSLQNQFERTLIHRPPQDANDIQQTNATTESSSSSMAAVTSALRQSCGPRCYCQCHRDTFVRSPTWLQSVVGTCMLNYKNLPFLNKRPCNDDQCKSRSRVEIQYVFPKWLLSRALYLSASWTSITGTGATLHLQVPVYWMDVRPWTWVQDDNVERLKVALQRKEVPLNAVHCLDGSSLLLDAIGLEKFEMTRILMDEGCSLSLRNKSGDSAVTRAFWYLNMGGVAAADRSFLQRVIASAGDEDTSGSSVVHDSVRGINRIPLAAAILQEPSAINSLDSCGLAPIHWAMYRLDEAAVGLLLSHGAHPDLAGISGARPLHILAQVAGDGDSRGAVGRILRLLLDAGCNIDCEDIAGQTPLVHSRSAHVVQMLLEAGADPNHIDDMQGAPPLSALIQVRADDKYHHILPDVTRMLLDHGADVNLRDNYGNPPLFHSLFCQHFEVFKILLHEYGASLDVKNDANRYFLHQAVLYGDLNLFEHLRTSGISGIDTELKDIYGNLPLDIMQWRKVVNPIYFQARQRRPTFLDELSCCTLIIELRERNWEQGHFVESKADPAFWERHLQLKSWIEGRWEKYCNWLQESLFYREFLRRERMNTDYPGTCSLDGRLTDPQDGSSESGVTDDSELPPIDGGTRAVVQSSSDTVETTTIQEDATDAVDTTANVAESPEDRNDESDLEREKMSEASMEGVEEDNNDSDSGWETISEASTEEMESDEVGPAPIPDSVLLQWKKQNLWARPHWIRSPTPSHSGGSDDDGADAESDDEEFFDAPESGA